MSSSANNKIYVKIGEAAKILGVSIDTLRRWEKAGKISAIRTPGGTRLYSISTLKKTNPHSFSENQARGLTTESLLKNAAENASSLYGIKEIAEVEENIEPFPSLHEAYSFQSTDSQSSTQTLPKTSLFFKVVSTKLIAASAAMAVLTIALTSWISASYLTQPTETQQFFKNNIASAALSPFHKLAEATVAVIDPQKAQQLGFAPPDPVEAPPGILAQNVNSKEDVLAVTSASRFLEVNTDTQINGSLFVRDQINNLSLEGTPSASTIIATSGDTTLTVTNDTVLDQNLARAASPTFSTLNLSATSNQLVMQSGGATGTLTWTPTAARIITLPDATTTLVGTDTTQTLTNKSLSGSSNTFTNIPNSGLTNSAVTVSAGTNLTGGGTVSLGGSISLALKSSPEISGVLLLDNGTAAAPSLAFTSDADTGLYRVGSNSLGLITGGTATSGITIDANGNVGVGIVSPTSTLHVVGTANVTSNTTVGGTFGVTGASTLSSTLGVTGATTLSSTLSVTGNSTFGTNTLFVNTTTGNVGIGTTSPNSTLNVIGGATIGGAYNSTAPTNGLLVQGNVGIGTTAPGLALEIAGSSRVSNSSSFFGSYRSEKFFSHADSTSGWDSPGSSFSTFGLDNDTKKEGLSSLSGTTSNTSTSARQIRKTTSSGDFSEFSNDDDYLELWFNISNVSLLNSGSNVSVEIGNAQDSQEYQWSTPITNISSGWNKLVYRLGDAEKTGTVDWNNLNYFRMFVFGNGSSTSFVAKIDDIKFVSNRRSVTPQNLSLNGDFGTMGNIGVGTVIPGAKLSVAGNIGIGISYATVAAPVNGLAVQGNIGIGTTSPTTALYVHGRTTVTNNILAENGYSADIGSSSQRFATGYFDTIDATSLSGTVTGGSTSNASWTINSDNATNDAEDMALTFERGTASPNASLTWNSTTAGASAGYFGLNSGLIMTGTITSTNGLNLSSFTNDIVTPTGEHLSIIPGTGGNVGIGTTSPSQYFQINYSNSNPFVVTTGGNVGIGVTSPDRRLQTASDIDIVSSNASLLATGGTQFSLTGDSSSGLSKKLVFGIDTTDNYGVIQAGNTSGSNYNLALNPAGGNIGIGATTSANKLDVWGDARVTGSLTVDTTLTGNLFRASNGSASAPAYSFTNLTTAGVWTNGDGILLTAGGTATRGVAVTNAGNVGVGTTAPIGKLQISGGQLIIPDSDGSNVASLAFAGATPVGLYRDSTGLVFTNGSNQSVKIGIIGYDSIPGVYLNSYGTLAWTNGDADGTRDLYLYRDAANVLAQRNDTTAQEFRIYNTYTSSTSNEFGKLEWAGNVFNIGTEKGSAGGSARALGLLTDNTERLRITTNGNVGIGTSAVATGVGGKLIVTDGNVGIGTTSPTAPFQVFKTGTNDPIARFGSPGGIINDSHSVILENPTGQLSLVVAGGASDYMTGLTQGDSGIRVSSGDDFFIGTNDTMPYLSILSGGNIGIGATTANSKLYVNGGLSIGSGFNTAAPTNGLLVQGNAGFGTISPTEAVEIKGPSTTRLLINAGANTFPVLKFAKADVAKYEIGVRSTTDDLYFYETDAGLYRMVIQDGGNVGIGVTTANSLLSVSGNAHIGSIRQGIAAPTDGLFVDGNVGIGATTSSNKLDIWGNARVTGSLTVDGAITSSSSQYLASDGSASSPSFSFINDTDTGLFRPGTDALGFATGATSRMTITAGGNIGIGVTDPIQPLHIRMSGSSQALRLENTAGNDPALEFINSTSGRNYITMDVNGGQGGGSAMVFATDNTPRLNIDFTSGNVGIGATTVNSKLYVNGGAAIGSGYNGLTAPTNGLLVQGNIGIGVTSPSAKLDIKLGSDGDDFLRIQRASSAGRSQIVLADQNASQIWRFGMTGPGSANNNFAFFDQSQNVLILEQNGNAYLTPAGNVGIGFTSPLFKLQVNSGSSTTFVNSSGNVGIGATTSSNKLDVWGNARVTGSLTVDGALVSNGSITPTGQFLAQDGSASLPGYAFTNDVDSGLWRIGTNQIALTTGAGAMSGLSINSNGNVGIGNTSASGLFQVSTGPATSGAGKSISLTAQTGASTSAGGAITLTSGAGGSSSGAGGAITIQVGSTGSSSSTDQSTLSILGGSISTGNPNNNGNGGPIAITAGLGGANSNGGAVTITGGGVHLGNGTGGTAGAVNLVGGTASVNGSQANGTGGAINLTGGTGVGTNNGGGIVLTGGTPGTTGAGGNISITSGAGGSSSGASGASSLLTGNATAGNSGSITIRTGTAGTGYLPGSINFQTNGANTRMFIDSMGNVGIGGSNPSQAKLVVQGNVGIGYTSVAIPANGLAVSGNVGIGTTSPQTKLHVWGDNTNSAFFMNGNVGIGTTAPTSALTLGSTSVLTVYNPGTSTGAVSISSPNGLPGIIGQVDDSGTLQRRDIRFTTDGIALLTTNGNNIPSANNGIIIYESGNLGIGATTSSNKLDVWGNARVTGTLTVDGAITSSSSQYLASDGSASSPSFSFINDTDTGLFRPSANALGFSTGATSRMTITAGGNVGIGITNPTSNLHIYVNTPSDTTNEMLTIFENADTTSAARAKVLFKIGGNEIGSIDSNPTSLNLVSRLSDSGNINLVTRTSGSYITRLFIGNSGNVGIGVTLPGSKLNVAGNAVIGFDTANTTTIAGPSNGLAVSGNVGIGLTSPLTRLHVWGDNTNSAFFMNGNVGIGNTAPSGALHVSATHASQLILERTGSLTGRWMLGTAQASNYFRIYDDAQGASRLLIDSNGNVGIGTITPGALFSVNGNAVVGYSGTANGPSNGLGIQGNVGIGATTANSALYVNGGATIGSGYNAVTAPTDGLVVQGNVGIGFSSPTRQLEVFGSANTEMIRANGTNIAATNYTELDVVGPQGNGQVNLGVGGASVPAANDLANRAYLTAGSTLSGLVLRADSSSGYIQLVTGGGATTNERMRIDSNGNVGIGISTANSKLSVSGNAHIGSVRQGISAPTDGLFVDGNVGIGATTSSNKLDVWGDARITGTLGVASTGTLGSGLIGYSSVTSPTSGLAVSGNVGIGTTTANSALEVVGAGAFNDGTAALPALTFRADTDTGIFRSSANGLGLSTGGVSRLTITANGNIGIGVTDPQSFMTVGPIYLADTFNRSNSTNLGSTDTENAPWTEQSGDMEISSNKVIWTSGSPNIATVESNSGDVDMTVTVARTTNGANGVVWRFADTSNYWLIRMDASGILLAKVVGGSTTTVMSGVGGSSGGLPNGTSGAYRVRHVGSNLQVFKDGVLWISTSDSALSTNTKHGIYGLGCNAGCTWDNMTIIPLSAKVGNNQSFSNINVGIGTSDPSSLAYGQYIRVMNSATHTANTVYGQYISFIDPTTLANTLYGLYVDTSNSNTNTIKNAAVFMGGNVGIGASLPNSTLSIQGNVGIGYTGINQSIPVNGLAVQGNVGIGVTTANSSLSVAGSAHIGGLYQGISAPTDGLFVDGNVGIGATTSSNKLDVWGNARVTGSLTVDGNTTFSGSQLSIPDGTAAAPGLNFVNDTDSGLWRNTTNLIALTTNGEGSLQSGSTINGLSINSSGNVGIGTTSQSYPLEIVTSGGTGLKITRASTGRFVQLNAPAGTGNAAILAASDGTTTTASLYIPTTAALLGQVWTGGNLGVGVTAAGSGLQVATNAVIGFGNAGTVVGPTSGLGVSGNVGIGTTTADRALEVVGTIRSSVADFVSGLVLRGSTPSSNRSGNLTFTDNQSTAQSIHLRKESNQLILIGTDASTTRFRIDGDGTSYSSFNGGNVGIGPSTPVARLDIQGTGSSTALNLWTRGSNGTQGLAVLDNGNVGIGTTAPSQLFQVNANASTPFVVTSGGNVGIGTTTPQSALQINSNVNLLPIATLHQGASNGVQVQEGLRITWDNGSSVAFNALWASAGSNANSFDTTQGVKLIYTQTGSTTTTLQSVYDNSGAVMNFQLRGGGTAVTPLTLLATGNVGVNTDSPSQVFQVNSGSSASVITSSGNIGIGATTANSNLFVNGGATIGGAYNLTAPTNGLLVQGNVGIGTTTPGSILEIAGNLLFSKEVARTISIANSTTSNTAGAALTINGANGAAGSSAGGNINIAGGVGIGTTAPGGALVLSAGAAGNTVTLASQFTAATTEYLSAASNSSLQTGDIDFSIGTWVYLDSKSAFRTIAAKDSNSGGGREYMLVYDNGSDRFALYTFDGTNNIGGVTASDLGSPATGTFYYIVAWHDKANDLSGITVFGGAAPASGVTNTGVDSGTPAVTSTQFTLGGRGSGTTNPWNGRIASVGFWKRILSTEEKITLYNNGRGLTYNGLPGSLLTNLISYWNLSEASGSRADSFSTNTLSDNNSVTGANGPSSSTGTGTGGDISIITGAGGDSSGNSGTLTFRTGSVSGAGNFAGSINFQTNGANTRMFIDHNGNVGIGASNPATAKLSVQGNVGIGYTSVAIPVNGLAVSGNVGIGITTANSTLSVAGSAHIGSVRQGVSAPTDGLFVDGNVGIGATTSSNKLDVWGNARVTGSLTVDGAITSSSSQYLASDGSASSPSFSFVNDADTGFWRVGANMLALTTAGSPQSSQAINGLSINSSGNVGIGTTSSTARLDLNFDGVSGTSEVKLFNIAANANNYTFTGSTDLSNQRFTNFDQQVFQINSGGVIDDVSTVYIAGAPRRAGGSGGQAVHYALRIAGGAVSTGSISTRAYGLYVDAPVGATSNYAAAFASGNVGIGTTIPNTAKLQIAGAGTTTGLSFLTTDSTGAQRFAILDNGNVGIGTTAPAYPIQLKGTYGTNGIALTPGSRSYTITASDAGGSISLGRTDSGNSLTISPDTTETSISSSLGNLAVYAGGDSSTLYLYAAPNNQTGNVVLGVRKDGALISGNVGIGNSNPGSKLQVSGNVGIGYTGANTAYAVPNLGLAVFGNVGIGTTTANSALEVAGTGAFEGGSLALPAITFRGDTDTGLWRIGANTLALTAGGSSQALGTTINGISVNSVGNVGIGGTNATGGAGGVDSRLAIFTNEDGSATSALNLINTTSIGSSGTGSSINFDLSPSFASTQRLGVITAKYIGGSSSVLTFSTRNGGSTTEKVRIDNAGNVGIGTSSPQTKLHVWGDGSNSSFFLNGGVGIGTTALGNLPNSLSIDTNGDTGNGFLSISGHQNTAFPEARFGMAASRGTANTPATLQANDRIGLFSMNGYDGSGYRLTSSIEGRVDGPVSTNSIPSNLSFYTTAVGATSRTERLTISAAGLVGIGISAPATELHLYSAAPTLSFTATNGASGARINTIGAALTVMRIQHNGSTYFSVGPNGNVGIGVSFAVAQIGSPSNGLAVQGNVGIGATTANSKLTVIGGATIGGAYNVPAPTNGLLVQGNVGIGRTDPETVLHVFGTSAGLIKAERSVSSTNTALSTAAIQLTSTGDMSDGFGPVFGFLARDTAGTVNELGYVGAVRNGADNSGRLVFTTNNAGTLSERMTITAAGNVGIGWTTPYGLLQVGTTFSAPTLFAGTGGNVGIGTTATSFNLSFGESSATIGMETKTSNSTGADLTISAGKGGPGAGSRAGGTLTLNGGNSNGTVTGASLSLSGGITAGGAVTISGGTATTSNVAGGAVTISAGAGSTAGGTGGALSLSAGAATSGGGGSISLTAGDAAGAGAGRHGGSITLTAGNANAISSGGNAQNGGSINLIAGPSTGTAGSLSGDITITSGQGKSTNASGTLVLATGTVVSGTAGPIVFTQNNNLRAAFDASGNLGIGTTSPSAKFTVAGSVGIGVSFASSSTIATDGLAVQGSVGIGTTTVDANAKLTVVNNFGAVPSSAATVITVGSSDGTTGGSSIRALGSITGNLADFGEYFPFIGNREDYEFGDLVVTTLSGGDIVERSNSHYQNNVLGIVTRASSFIAGADSNTEYDQNGNPTNRLAVALLGRVPLKVSTENGAIKPGDFLTSSSIPGVAMKATRPGQVVGKALESFDGSNGEACEIGIKCSKVLTFVSASFADPSNFFSSLSMDEEGNLIMPKLKVGKLSISPELAVASSELTTDGTQIVANEDSGVDSTNPGLASSSDTYDVAGKIATLEDTLKIQESRVKSLEERLAQLEASDSAQIAGVSTESTDSATPSADLASELDLLNLTDPSVLLASDSANLIASIDTYSDATFSGVLTAYQAQVQDSLKVYGNTTLSNTNIAGDLNVDGTLSIETGNTINVVGTLFLQKALLADKVDIFDGKIVIGKDGNIQTVSVTADQFKVNENKSAGSAKILSGQTEIVIDNPYAEENSIIVVTPNTPLSQTLAVVNKSQSQFTVKLLLPETQDINFDYVIIGVAKATPGVISQN